MTRPAVDVVVPFRGPPAELAQLAERLGCVRLRLDDSLLVVDNTPGASRAGGDREPALAVLHADDRPTPAFARNRGAAAGTAPWIVFLDADAVPAPDLLDRYFEPPPGERTALLGGGTEDEPVPAGGPPVGRYAHLRGVTSQEGAFRHGPWAYPKTANVACRRAAFTAVGGFREALRAAEDADLAYRLRAAGWELEWRERALVVHRNRQTLRDFVAQRAVHGAGGAWLDAEYPGCFPPRRLPGLIWWGVRVAAKGLLAAVRTRDRDRAICALLEPVDVIAWELGRSRSNERPAAG